MHLSPPPYISKFNFHHDFSCWQISKRNWHICLQLLISSSSLCHNNFSKSNLPFVFSNNGEPSTKNSSFRTVQFSPIVTFLWQLTMFVLEELPVSVQSIDDKPRRLQARNTRDNNKPQKTLQRGLKSHYHSLSVCHSKKSQKPHEENFFDKTKFCLFY